MSEKRRDNKGRLLKKGENQRKDGKYEYKYLDSDGKRRSLYSWQLIETDVVPPGKKESLPLRKQIDVVLKDIDKGINIRKSEMTLAECIIVYLENKQCANATLDNYQYYFNKDIKDSALGRMFIRQIKKSNVKQFYAQCAKKYSNGTIQILHKIIRPSLDMAVEDEIIGKNQAEGACKDYGKTESRTALTAEEQEIFFNEILKFNRNGERYRIIYGILVGLACRINELIGLTWKDVDMKKRIVDINHGLLYRRVEGKTKFYITKGTCKSACRKIPMSDNVYRYFCALREQRFKYFTEATVDGYSDFVFVGNTGMPLYPPNLNKQLTKMVKKYKEETGNDFPMISNHIFRHSGCTRMAEAGIDINTLMHIMGHRNLKMILEVYDSVGFDRINLQMKKMNVENEIHKIENDGGFYDGFTTDLRQRKTNL